MEHYQVTFRRGKPRDRQRRIFEELQTKEIFSTRYIDENCLYNLGFFHSVCCRLDNIGLHDIFIKKEPTFEYLNREFLSSLIYIVHPNTTSTCGTIRFRMLNVEYEYTTDELSGLLEISYGEGALCETPLDSEWSSEAFEF